MPSHYIQMQVELSAKTQQPYSQLNEALLEQTESKSQRTSRESSLLRRIKETTLSPMKIGKIRARRAEAESSEKGALSSVRATEVSRAEQPQQFEVTSERGKSDFVYNNYDIWDLTYSLVCAKIDRRLLGVFFVLQVVSRYVSILSLVYITVRTYSEQWEWVFILITTNTIYFICIVKISLKPAETQSEFILKQSFNSLEVNEISEYFQVFSPRKFLTSIARGMVPPEFSCLYIRDHQRRAEIYAMINFIYCGIEAVIYYPFFIVYMVVINHKDRGIEENTFFYTSAALIVLFETSFIVTAVYLLVFGCRKKGYFSKKANHN